MMGSNLRERVRRLERGNAGRDWLRGATEFRFVMYTKSLPEGTVVPEGARVVVDFHSQLEAPNWAGRPGVTFRSGYRTERITSDSDDFGRVIEMNADDRLGPEAQPESGME